MKKYLISYTFSKKSHPGIIISGILGWNGELAMPAPPSREEVIGLVFGDKPNDYVLTQISISQLPDNWLDDKDIVA